MRSFLLLIIITLFSAVLYGQVHYLENYPGIPIVAHLNVDSRNLTDANLAKMVELGIYGFYASDMSNEAYNKIIAHKLKVFPYQIWIDSALVTAYTDAVYTRWEAEGNLDKTKGDVELKHSDLGSVEGEFLVTNVAQPGTLVKGPAYAQDIKYKLLPSPHEVINYDAGFRMKISKIEPNLPIEYINDAVCTLRIVATDPCFYPPQELDIVTPKVVTVGDFLSLSGGIWDSCVYITINSYTLASLNDLSLKEFSDLHTLNPTEPIFSSKWMQYKIEWSGLPYLRLYVDHIEISDLKGRRLVFNENTRINIKNYVKKYSDEQNVLGWFGLNEPGTIDKFEPFRIIDNIIQSANPKLRLYTTYTTGWIGLNGGNQPGNLSDLNGYVYKGTEFIKRTGLPYISLNTYMYNWPWFPEEASDYYLKNIDEVTINNLPKLKLDENKRIPLSHSVQSGKFSNIKGSIYPTAAQLLYDINLGLLYGMKELTCDPFFTLTTNGNPYREGLVNFYDNSLTPLGEVWKNIVAPRMSGLPGKTIKKLSPKYQLHNQPAGVADFHFIHNVFADPMVFDSDYLDIGIFEDTVHTDADYFMIINRYYSNNMLQGFTLRNLTGYTNWELTDYMDTSRTTYITSDGNILHERLIQQGDGRLFSILPVIRYGGDLIASETFTGTDSLLGDMTVRREAVLTVNGTYHIKAAITVEAGGEIIITPGSNLVFYENGSLTVNGRLIANGNPYNRITFDFTDPAYNNGIIADGYSEMSVQNCTVMNADAGIQVISSPSSLTKIKWNEFHNCNTAVSLVNSSSVLIQGNTISDCRIGIFAGQSVNLDIIGNTLINSSSYPLDGLFLNSSSANIRSNHITGYLSGILLGNS